jgi:hypothetical protein
MRGGRRGVGGGAGGGGGSAGAGAGGGVWQPASQTIKAKEAARRDIGGGNDARDMPGF